MQVTNHSGEWAWVQAIKPGKEELFCTWLSMRKLSLLEISDVLVQRSEFYFNFSFK